MNVRPLTICITFDLAELLQRNSSKLLPINFKNEITTLSNKFVEEFSRLLPENIHLTTDISARLGKLLIKYARRHSKVLLSLDNLSSKNADFYYQTANITSSDGSVVWVTPKISDDTSDVREKLQNLSKDKEIILGDIGAQSGQTLEEAIRWCAREGIKINSVILGIAGKSVVQKLNHLVKEVHVLRLFEYLRWFELRDLLGVDGRLFKDKLGCIHNISSLEISINTLPVQECRKLQLKMLCRDYHAQLLEICTNVGIRTMKGDIETIDYF